MTEISFYTFAADRLAVLRQLAAKAYGQKRNVLIHTADPALAENVDRMLWANPPLSFLPHCRDSGALARQTPILIGVNVDSLAKADVLINLDDNHPAQFSRFDRVLEIVTTDEEDRARGRQRYRFYQERGYSIKTHDLRHAE